MANGNTEALREMKRILEQGKPIDIDTRDRLLFTAVIDIYENQALLWRALRPALMFYQVGMFFASAIGLAVLGVLGGVITGKIGFVFK